MGLGGGVKFLIYIWRGGGGGPGNLHETPLTTPLSPSRRKNIDNVGLGLLHYGVSFRFVTECPKNLMITTTKTLKNSSLFPIGYNISKGEIESTAFGSIILVLRMVHGRERLYFLY